MKKTLVSVAGALALVVAISVVPVNTNLGLLSPDVVSAASEAAPVTTPTKTTTKTPTKTTTTKTSTSKSSILRYGSKGTTVKTLQTSLNKNGYKLKVDGVFGAKTLKAVKDYQKKHGLRVDGLVGPKTIAKFTVTSPNTTTPVVTTPVVTTPVVTAPVDAVTTASIVNKNDTFKTAISKNGKWIIAILKDLTFNEDLVLDGTFKNSKGATSRKIALYAQDKDKNVTDRFTLTAPKLIVKSPSARIQSGTFKGDVYATAANFELIDATVKGNVYVSAAGFKMSKYAKVEGNIYFMNEAAKTSFDTLNTDSTCTVTGKTELAVVDTVTGASIVNNTTAFEKAINKTGEWIIAILKDLDFGTKDLVLDGTFKNGKKDKVTGIELIQRKIALYTQDEKHNVTGRFTLTAKSLTVKSANASIQHGTFKGNLYVSALNFQLVDSKVVGNVYFTSQAAKDTFIMDAKSSIAGKQFVKTN